MQLVNIDSLFYYLNNELILDNISISVDKGDILGIIGPNGSGKTTLFSCLLGLIRDYRGSITVLNSDTKKDNSYLAKVGYLPQKCFISESFPATAEEIVSLGISGKDSKSRIKKALENVELDDIADKRMNQLSGGQQQRVLIAKAIVNNPEILILDEPTNSVDIERQRKFYMLLKKLNTDLGITIIWSSHDLDAVNKVANRIACMNRTLIYHGQTHAFFSNEKLLKQYSESSMQAHMHSHFHDKEI